jgi:hypothetical protein
MKLTTNRPIQDKFLAAEISWLLTKLLEAGEWKRMGEEVSAD